MKHWKKSLFHGSIEDIVQGILLRSNDRVLGVFKENDKFRFMELCDEWAHVDYTKEEALELIDELRKWVEEN